MFVWKLPKINEKEAGDGPFFKEFTKLEVLQYEELNVKIVYKIVHRRLTPICTQLGLSDRVKKPAMYLPIS